MTDAVIITCLLLFILLPFALVLCWSFIQKRTTQWHWMLRHLFNAGLCAFICGPAAIGSAGGEPGFALPVPVWFAAIAQGTAGWDRFVLFPFIFWSGLAFIIFLLRSCLVKYVQRKISTPNPIIRQTDKIVP